jgi:phage tail sheath protein FI
MATAYYTPGVYIEEVDKGTKPIQGVSTSVTAFIGFTARAEKVQEDGITTRSILGAPTLVTNWAQFESHFGSYHPDAYLPYAVRGFFDNGGTRCYVISVRAIEAHHAQMLVYGAGAAGSLAEKTPVLLLRAVKPGADGDSRHVQLRALDAEEIGQLSDDAKKKKRYQLVIHEGAPGAAADSQPAAIAEQLKQAQSAVAEQQTQAGQLKRENDGRQKEMNKDHSAEDLAKIRHDWEENSKRLEEATKLLEAKKEEVRQLEAAQKSAADAAANANAKTLEFSLESLPVWGERRAERSQWERWSKQTNHGDKTPAKGSFIDQKLQQQNDPGISVEVWKLHRQGREAALLPALEEAPRSLKGGAWQLDNEFLVDKGVTGDIQTISANTDQAALVVNNAKLLYQGDEARRNGVDGLFAFDEVNLVCAPDVMKAYEVLGKDRREEADALVKAVQEQILTFCRRAHYPFAILDAPPGKDVQAIADWRMALPGADTMYGALYYPWLKIADPFDATRQIEIPPCGHIAGIYARSDNQRGVHKAPANELVSGALDLPRNVTKNEQELLNPIGVNCIRSFSGRGIRIWGARTLAMTDPSWRYINVRRLFSYVEASVERSTQWVVFEPNDHILWAKVRRDVTAFLRTVWLSGALFGVTPEEAFYVKCDAETNPPELRDLGQMVCEIGLAPVKPAEFVIFRFSQWTADAESAG